MSSPIDVSAVPGGGLDPEKVERAASDLGGVAGAIRLRGSAVLRAWSGLRECYLAPEAERLHQVMAPVNKDAHDFADDLDQVSRALHRLAEELREVVRRRKDLVAEAEAFNAKAEGPEWLQWAAEASDWVSGRPHWQSVPWMVEEYNRLIGAAGKLQGDLAEVEQRCADTIRGIDGAGGLGAMAPGFWSGQNVYRPSAEPAQPWGEPVDWDVWDLFGPVKNYYTGVWVDGVWGGLTDAGAMVGLGGKDAFLETWSGMGQLLGRDAATGAWWQGDAAGDAWVGLGKSLVAWDLWSEDPGRALGNVALLAIPGVGAVRVVKALGAAGTAGRVTRAVPDVDVPGKGPGMLDRALGVVTSDKALDVAARIDRAVDPLGTLAEYGFRGTRSLLDGIDFGGGRGGDATPDAPVRSADVPVARDAGSGRLPDPAAVPDADQARPVEASPRADRAADDNPLPQRAPEPVNPRVREDNSLPPTRAEDPATARMEDPRASAGTLDREPASVGGRDTDTAVQEGTRSDASSAAGGGGGDSRDGSAATGGETSPDRGDGTADRGDPALTTTSGGGVDHGTGPDTVAAVGRGDGASRAGDADPVVWRSADAPGLSLTESQRAHADDLLAHAHQVEPAVRSLMKVVTDDHAGVRLENLGVKPDADAYRDLATGLRRVDATPERLVADTYDTLRFRAVVDEDNFATSAQGVIDDLAGRGYRPVGTLENGWGQWGPQGIRSHWMTPSGEIIEVDFHTPDSLAARAEFDALDERWRDPDTSDAERARIEQEMDVLSRGVPRPAGAAEVEWPDRVREWMGREDPWRDGRRAEELASTVPGGSRRALHAGSMPENLRWDYVMNTMPEVLDVNYGRYAADRAGFDQNCTRSALAADLALSGKNVIAGPSAAARPITDISDALGGTWQKADGPDAVVDRMNQLGDGSRAVVAFKGPDGEIGHVVNVVKPDGHPPVFVDAQTGDLARIRPGDDMYFLETSPGRSGTGLAGVDAETPGLSRLTTSELDGILEAAGHRDVPETPMGEGLDRDLPTSFPNQFDEMLTKHDLTPERFDELVDTPIDRLSRPELKALVELRRDLPEITPDTVLQKVISPQAAARALEDMAENAGPEDLAKIERLREQNAEVLDGVTPDSYPVDRVGGFVSRAADVFPMKPSEIYRRLALDYENSPFIPGDKPMFAIEYRAGDNAPTTSSYVAETALKHHDDLDGLSGAAYRSKLRALIREDYVGVPGLEAMLEQADRAVDRGNPYRGTGFAGENGVASPENQYLEKVGHRPQLSNGTELWAIRPDGTREAFARFEDNGEGVLAWVMM